MYSYRIVHKDGIETKVDHIHGFYTKDGLLLLTDFKGTVRTMLAICNIVFVEVIDINQPDEQEQE